MSTVRKALDDYGSPARFVETRWAEGYRFVGPCVEFEDDERSARASVRASSVRKAPGIATAFRNRETRRAPAGSSSAAMPISAVRDIAAIAMRSRCFASRSQMDPEDARAHGGIAAATRCSTCMRSRPIRIAPRHVKALRTSLELDSAAPTCSTHAPRSRSCATITPKPIAAFREAESLAPTQFRIWYYHGRGHAEQGDHEGALARYLRASRRIQATIRLLALAEQSFHHVGLHDDARRAAQACVRAAEEVLRRHPDDVRALSLVACVLPKLDRNAEAQGWTERAVALEPLEPFVNFNAACVYIALGEPRARTAFSRAGHPVGRRQLQLDRARSLHRSRAVASALRCDPVFTGRSLGDCPPFNSAAVALRDTEATIPAPRQSSPLRFPGRRPAGCRGRD